MVYELGNVICKLKRRYHSIRLTYRRRERLAGVPRFPLFLTRRARCHLAGNLTGYFDACFFAKSETPSPRGKAVDTDAPAYVIEKVIARYLQRLRHINFSVRFSVLAENIRKDAATLSRKGKPIPAPEKSSPSPIASIPDMGKLQAVSSGTGFYFTNDGYLATNHHVIENGARFLVLDTRTGEYAEADFVAQDPEGDLAILHVRGKKSQPIPLAKRFDLRRGEDVMTLGYPRPRLQGAQQKATFGRVNSAKGMHDDISNVQVDLPIQPGNSGGPLIDSKGRAVGVVASTLGLRSQNVNYAIKIDLLHTLIGTVPDLSAASSSSGRKLSFPELAEKFESSVVMIRVYK